MNTVPNFSFSYRGKPYDLGQAQMTLTEYGRCYDLPDGLRIELHIEEIPAYNAIRWMLWWENRGQNNSGQISNICDCDTTWFAPGEQSGNIQLSIFDTTGNTSYESYLRAEETAEECSVHERKLPLGACRRYRPNGGRSGSGQMPFFDLFTPGENGGHGLIYCVGWTGQWQAAFTHKDGGAIQLQSGLEHVDFYLKPGERIRTSSVLMMDYTGSQTKGSNTFRRLVKNVLSPVPAERLPFAIEGMGIPTEMHLNHLEQFARHGVKGDYYWIDAGWYGKGGNPGASDWYKQVGNWQVRPDEHPDGLKDVLKKVHESGMELLLWMEPERVYPGTDLALAHPEWLYPEDGFYLLLHLDRDEVREYLFDLICGFIDELDIKCFRQDFNMEPLRSWQVADEMYRSGMNEIRYIMNLYRLWDDLRAKYPDLIIDNCASGGRRIDVESLQRTVPIWRTDAYCEPTLDFDTIQTQMFGFNRFIPCSGGVCKQMDTYSTRSAYAPAYVGSWWWTNRPTPTDEQFAWMAERCAEYRALRPYFSCDFYPLENAGWSYAHGGWAAWRYDRPEEGDGIVMAFRRAGSACVTACYPMEGLLPNKIYRITDIDTGESRDIPGKTLVEEGLTVTIPNRRESKIFKYFQLF